MNDAPPISEMTLDELRPLLARELPRHAGFDGWNAKAVGYAADALGIDPAVAALVFDGPVAMIDAWFASVDAAMLAALPAETLANMKVRERITRLVETRLDILRDDREALKRALSILASPLALGTAARLGWRAADVMWRAAGDTATDYNHYTKRAILSSVYAATITVFVDDNSENEADTRAFLARRIDGIMQFEKLKARVMGGGGANYGPSLARLIGRFRYPA